MKYIYYRELQDYMNQYWERTGIKLSFAGAMQRALRDGVVHDGPQRPVDFTGCTSEKTEEILEKIGRIAIPYVSGTLDLERSSTLQASLIVLKYPDHGKAGEHVQAGLELNYVMKGSCTMLFEGREYTLRENEVVIIPPNVRHDVYNTEGSIVFSFLIHQDVFRESFFQVLKTDSALSEFYDAFFYRNAKMFLRFSLREKDRFLSVMLAMYSEQYTEKDFKDEICINYVRIMFAYLLRQPQGEIKYQDMGEGEHIITDMPMILRYIRKNYRTVSLGFLAVFFHYDRSYIGKQIKKYTRKTFSELVTEYRLADAMEMLTTTRLSMEEIAEQSGYQSADHFSRMFKSKYGMAPSVYRKQQSAGKENISAPG